MSGSSSVPRPSWTDKGFIAAPETDLLAGVNADMNAAFGGNLNTGTSGGTPTNPTPQGQLAASLAAIIGDKDAQFLFYTSQVDPAYASGRMQDGIARIYFITRNPALSTLVTATCTGAAGVVIPAGATAQASDGNLYICQGAGTIPLSGTIDLQFACAVTGPITCPGGTPGSLATIYQMIPGWDTINNAADGVIGRNVESRAEFEARRSASVAKNSMGMLTSVIGAVLAVPDVLDAYVTENPSGGAVTIGGVSVAAHSLYVAAVGGVDLDVATAIWSKKAPGCGYTGTTTVAVLDASSGYSLPYPSYNVTFTRPASTEIVFKLSMVSSLAVPSDALAQIQTAVIAAFAGTDGGLRARIGGTILASRFYGGIAALGAWARIISLEVGSGNAASFTGAIAGTTLTVSALTGTMAVGQLVRGVGVLPATYIVAQLTGTAGLAGTYTVSLTQTVASEAMTAVAFSDSLTLNINQAPSTAAADVNLTLV
jgi:hypothetical protein